MAALGPLYREYARGLRQSEKSAKKRGCGGGRSKRKTRERRLTVGTKSYEAFVTRKTGGKKVIGHKERGEIPPQVHQQGIVVAFTGAVLLWEMDSSNRKTIFPTRQGCLVSAVHVGPNSDTYSYGQSTRSKGFLFHNSFKKSDTSTASWGKGGGAFSLQQLAFG